MARFKTRCSSAVRPRLAAIQETLCLLAVPGMRESIKEGMAVPLAQSKSELDW